MSSSHRDELGDPETVEPDEIAVWVTDDRAIVLSSSSGLATWRGGRRLVEVTGAELRSLLQHLDPVTRAMVEAKRLTGSLVELHPTDREMFKSGFKAIREQGGWLQANFRDHGQVTRLMRVRPATGVAIASGGALALAAVAAQAQAAELAADIKAIGHRVDQLYVHLQDEQIGAVTNVAEQVERFVDMLRRHGIDGLDRGEVAVIRSALGEARNKVVQHLKTAVANIEAAVQSPIREADQVLTGDAVESVTLYLDLVGRLYGASLQFGLAEVAFDCHSRLPDVAKTRAAQIITVIDDLRAEVEDVIRRLAALDEGVRGQFAPLWKRAAKEIPKYASIGAAGGALAGAAAAVAPAAAEAISSDGAADASEESLDNNTGKLALIGSVGGSAVGAFVGARNVVQDGRARKPVEAKLTQLEAAGSRSREIAGDRSLVLDRLQDLINELLDSGVALRDAMLIPPVKDRPTL